MNTSVLKHVLKNVIFKIAVSNRVPMQSGFILYTPGRPGFDICPEGCGDHRFHNTCVDEHTKVAWYHELAERKEKKPYGYYRHLKTIYH